MQQSSKPRLGDLASSIAHVPWNSGDSEDGNEALEAMFDGAYTDWYVCPPRTSLEAVEVEYLDANTVQVEHSDPLCTVVAARYF